MSELIITGIFTILGVFLGGWISSRNEMQKWKKEKKIESLLNKKNEYREFYEKYQEKISKNPDHWRFDRKMITDSIVLPEYIHSVYFGIENEAEELFLTGEMEDDEYYGLKKREWSNKLAVAMKRALVDIDKQIEEEINK